MRRALVVVAGGMFAGGCNVVLDPPGAEARSIAGLWWLLFWLGLVPIVVVVALLILMWRRRGPRREGSDRFFVVYGGVLLSSLLLIPVVVATALTQIELTSGGGDPMEIRVTGHQFWWEIEYVTVDGDTVRSANELHLPVGTPVDLHLSSKDVIHSVWIPELAGKLDLVPGRENILRVEAERAGVYEGRCAEFCGLGHALMQLIVVAHEPGDFDSWLAAEAAPALVEVDTDTLEEFANSCAPCHTVRGLFEDEAYEGEFGPDLTHVASRRMIGANILPNTPEALARWIIDPQGVKPGNRMPDVGLDAEGLNAVLELLEQLD